jgi:hypothetical protein
MVGIILIASASAAMAQLLRRMEKRFERRRPAGSPITLASRLRDAPEYERADDALPIGAQNDSAGAAR